MIDHILSKYKHGNEPHEFVLSFQQRLDLKRSNEHDAFQRFSIYYMWKNIRQQYTNNKLEIRHIYYMIKEHETLLATATFIFSSTGLQDRITNTWNNETICKQKKLIDKTNNGENVPSLEEVKVVLVQSNLVDNQYQQKSEVLYIFTPNKFCGYLLNI